MDEERNQGENTHTSPSCTLFAVSIRCRSHSKMTSIFGRYIDIDGPSPWQKVKERAVCENDMI